MYKPLYLASILSSSISRTDLLFSACAVAVFFFSFVSRHPKLSISNGIQILDLLARQYLNDVCNATAISVPFIMISSKFNTEVQC